MPVLTVQTDDGLLLLCSRILLEDGTSVPKRLGVLKTLSNCILLSEYVGECVDPSTKCRILTSQCNQCLSCKLDNWIDLDSLIICNLIYRIFRKTHHILQTIYLCDFQFLNVTASGPGRKLPSCYPLLDPWRVVNIFCRRVTINVTVVVNIAHIFELCQRICTGLGDRDLLFLGSKLSWDHHT